MKASLTKRYCFQQITYWMILCGIVSFATAFLMKKGFSAAQVGVILFLADVLSSLLQQVVATAADKSEKPILRQCILFSGGISAFCFVLILCLPMPKLLIAFFYLFGVLSSDLLMPLLNSLSVFYNSNGYPINYGLGRGLSAMAFSFASLIIGYLMEYTSENMMLVFVLVLYAAFFCAAAGYPNVIPEHRQTEETVNSCSLLEFFARYKRYAVSLLGIVCLAAFHSMTENYMIRILDRLGGDSSSFGTALFIATLTACPVMIFFGVIQKKLGTRRILLISAAAFALKGFLFLCAKSVWHIYVIELLQCVTYNFLSPVELYYAEESVSPADMVKGQAVITASYTLGCAFGNLAGGSIITAFGVLAMMRIALALAILGGIILALTVKKSRGVRPAAN